MKSVRKTPDGVACPKCSGRQFVGTKTVKGRIMGGFLFAPQRLKCVQCGEKLKSG